MDHRFLQNNITISSWLDNAKKIYRKFDELEADLTSFFKDHMTEEQVEAEESAQKLFTSKGYKQAKLQTKSKGRLGTSRKKAAKD